MFARRPPAIDVVLSEKVKNARTPKEASEWLAVRRELIEQDEISATGDNSRLIVRLKEARTSIGALAMFGFGAYLVGSGLSLEAGVFLAVVAAGLLGLPAEFIVKTAKAVGQLITRDGNSGKALAQVAIEEPSSEGEEGSNV
jgi:hypothetical protein